MLDQSPLRARQYLVVALCVLLNAIDGFDILAISFASPGISAEWHIGNAGLGIVLSMELVGMALGSLLLGQIADRFGRRPAILGCLAIMTIGMAVCSQVQSVRELALLRLVTGLGIGGMLSAVSAVAAESVNLRSRATAIALTGAGYPLGGAVGGVLATLALGRGDWRSVFHIGALLSAGLFLLAMAMLKETPAFLARATDAPGSLRRLNLSLRALGHPALEHMPLVAIARRQPVASVSALFGRDLRLSTLALVGSYFCHVTTFYFVLKWVPKIMVDLGFTPVAAGHVMVAVSTGGLIGAVAASLLSFRLDPRRLAMLGAMLASGSVAGFGLVPHSLHLLTWAGIAAGFLTNGTLVLFYALAAEAFPTQLRASGTGLVVGIGRGGSAVGPVAAGLLLQWNLGVSAVCAVMAAGSALSALMLWSWLRLDGGENAGKPGIRRS